MGGKNKWNDRFPGFRRSYHNDFFTYPNELAHYWRYLSNIEQVTLDLILRQTLGFQKTWDDLSLSQLADGQGEAGAHAGTGMSVSQVRKALEGLEKKGLIRIKKRGRRTSRIYLVLEEDDEPDFDPFRRSS